MTSKYILAMAFVAISCLALATACSSTNCSVDEDCPEGKVCKLGICATSIGGQGDTMEDVQLDCRLAAPGDLLLHEILADGSLDVDGDGSPDDLSGDGETDGSDEEFIEIVNLANEPVGLLNVYFEISSTTAYPTPVCVPSMGSHVHFGSTQSLSLNNSGEEVRLYVNGELADLYDYPGLSDESWTRSPQLTAESVWVKHSTVSLMAASPGTCSNGNAFPDCEGGMMPDADAGGSADMFVPGCDEPAPQPGQLIITEILADPGANDANLDGEANDDDEFVEIVNISGQALSLDDLVFTEAGDNTVSIPRGTCLPADGVLLIFGDVSEATQYEGAVVASYGSKLGLNNTNDTLTLKVVSNGEETIVDQVSYGSQGGDDQSIVRAPELEADSSLVTFVRHDQAYGAEGALMSPGRCADGALFPACSAPPTPETCEGRAPIAGDLLINEFLSNPGGADVNGDGESSSAGDEFIEIVNRTSDTLDLSGVTVRTGPAGGEAVQYTFPVGACINSRQGSVIFGGGTPVLGAEDVLVQVAGLSLNNGGDSIALVDVNGAVLDQHAYSQDLSGESWCREVEGDPAAAFIKHSETVDARAQVDGGGDPVLYSPGTCVDGSPLAACL